MKDMNRKEIKIGDILLEYGRGSRFSSSKKIKFYCLWQYKGQKDSRGIIYNMDGSETYFYHVDPKKSVILKDPYMPLELEYSFYHGLHDLECIEDYTDPYDIITNSNWKENKITESDVEIFNKLDKLNLNNISDFQIHLDLISKSKYFPNSFIYKVFKIIKKQRTKCKNGEIGLAMINDLSIVNIFLSYVKFLNNKLHYFIKGKNESYIVLTKKIIIADRDSEIKEEGFASFSIYKEKDNCTIVDGNHLEFDLPKDYKIPEFELNYIPHSKDWYEAELSDGSKVLLCIYGNDIMYYKAFAWEDYSFIQLPSIIDEYSHEATVFYKYLPKGIFNNLKACPNDIVNIVEVYNDRNKSMIVYYKTNGEIDTSSLNHKIISIRTKTCSKYNLQSKIDFYKNWGEHCGYKVEIKCRDKY